MFWSGSTPPPIPFILVGFCDLFCPQSALFQSVNLECARAAPAVRVSEIAAEKRTWILCVCAEAGLTHVWVKGEGKKILQSTVS